VSAGAFSAGGWAAHVREGTLRLLASMEADRSEVATDVPTLIELGYPYRGNAVQYMLAPKGVPAAVFTRLTEAFLAASRSAKYIDIAKKNALYQATTITGAALDKQLAADRAELTDLVNRLGLKKK
jgi:tripartite-type tricarboxylate transporter receptor subunit TctC